MNENNPITQKKVTLRDLSSFDVSNLTPKVYDRINTIQQLRPLLVDLKVIVDRAYKYYPIGKRPKMMGRKIDKLIGGKVALVVEGLGMANVILAEKEAKLARQASKRQIPAPVRDDFLE
jgi:hypothetical protein